MEASAHMDAECLVLDVVGEVDMYEAPDLFQFYGEYARRYPQYPVLVNIERVYYLDSSGIGVLFKMFADSNLRGVRFFVCGAKGMVAALFELSKMNSILPRAETVRSAQKTIRSIA